MKQLPSQKQWKANYNARYKNGHFVFRMKKTILFRKYPFRRLNFLIEPGDGLPF